MKGHLQLRQGRRGGGQGSGLLGAGLMDATTGSKPTITIGAIRETGSIILVHNILILGEGRMHEAIRAAVATIILVATIISMGEVVDNEETTGLYYVLIVVEQDMSVHSVLLIGVMLTERMHICLTTMGQLEVILRDILYTT